MREQVTPRGGVREQGEWQRKQNGGLHEETPPMQHRKPERTFSRGGSVRSPEAAVGEEQDDVARLEAERKLEELKRRRDDAEVEEFEKMRQKQQEAEQELEELKKRREERRKVLEEEERQKKHEEEERKAREEEEKRRMKEDIERRRAEAAEKRQKVEDTMDGGEARPFKCVSPRGSSLKIGERAEFLNRSAQKSSLKQAHSPVVSKIGNRLEQYTSAAQRENRDSRSPRSGAVDLPMVTDGIRNIKSMWEKGNVSNSPGGAGGIFKEAAGMKIGVAGRINDWLNKTPESKSPGGRPADLKPGDVTNKRSLWENKGTSPTKTPFS